MARTAGKKQAPAKIEDDDEAEGWEDAVVDTDADEKADLRLRDWRDVERYREMKELRRLVDDDYGLEEIFHIPLKPRAEPGIPGARTAAHKNGPKGAAAAAAKPPKGGKAEPAPKNHSAPKNHAVAKNHAAPRHHAAPKKPAPGAARARSEGAPKHLKAKAKRR